MSQSTQFLRNSIQKYKNELIHSYFRTRIKSNQDPYQVSLRKEPYKVLFILSHMRSGSSLLTNILCSNNAIKGYGETHIQYSSENSLKNLMLNVYFFNQEFRKVEDLKKLRMDHTYLLDKLLHDNKLLDENLLRSPNFYFIFLAREPKRSLLSMLDHKPHWSEKEAVQYYSSRLLTLTRYAEIIDNKDHCLFITHHQLINKTDGVFKSLQAFLKTPSGFSEQYQVSNTTGKRYVGDFKENIRSGQIVRKQREINIEISKSTLEQATDSFVRCQAKLSKTCTNIDS